jgi:hypothetical protein
MLGRDTVQFFMYEYVYFLKTCRGQRGKGQRAIRTALLTAIRNLGLYYYRLIQILFNFLFCTQLLLLRLAIESSLHVT